MSYLWQTPQRTAASLVGVKSRQQPAITWQRRYQIIYDQSQRLELLEGEIEADESYFGGRRKGQARPKVPQEKHLYLVY